jgi:gluconolactonase
MKIKLLLLLLLPLLISCSQPENYGEFKAADESFHAIVPSNAIVQKIGNEFQFTEGPVWSEDGFLLFSDIPGNKIYMWTPGGEVTVFMDQSNNPNGLAYDSEGRLLVCEHSGRAIVRYEKDGTRVVMADKYQGKKLSSPNDLAIHSSGAVFFTDPPWGLPGLDKDPGKEIPFNGVYLLKEGMVHLIDSTLYRPNGIALSPDEKYLFVGNNEPSDTLGNLDTGKKSWFRYTLNEELMAIEKLEFFTAPDSNVPGSPDGMKVDVMGNFYCTGPEGLLIFNADGKYLGIITFPELPTNCAFGGKDNKTLFVTARKQVFMVNMKIKGL